MPLNEYRTLALSHIYWKAVGFRAPRRLYAESLSVAEIGTRGKAYISGPDRYGDGSYPEAVTYETGEKQ